MTGPRDSDAEQSSDGQPEAGRPRPQFGEYATPEQQRAHIRQPDASWAIDSGHSPGVAGPPPGGAHGPYVPPAAGGYPSPMEGRAPGQVAKPRTVDRIVTFFLLGYGLFQIMTTIGALLDFERLANLYFEMLGVEGAFTNVEAGRVWGVIAAIVLSAGWALTALLSWRRVRARKVTWWLPLVGAVITYFVASACIAVPLMSDPAFGSFRLLGNLSP